MPALPSTWRTRTAQIAARLIEFSNVPAQVVDRAADDARPDIDTASAFVAADFGTLARIPRRLRKAQERARAAGDARPAVLVAGFENADGECQTLAVMDVADLGRLLGATMDARGVAA